LRQRGERSGATLAALRHRVGDLDIGRVLAIAVPVVALVCVVRAWPVPLGPIHRAAPLGVILDGALGGGRIALVALGIALVYRANRVVNFAQGDLGQLPTTIVVILVVSFGWNYYLGAAIGLAAAIVLGILVETLIIRRFFKAPRLILTVATIGLAQLLIWASFALIGTVEETSFQTTRLNAPFKLKFELEGTIFNANDVIAMVVVPICFVALAVWLRRSNVGVAVRASAERADRAATLGIPVQRLHTIVWTVATVLAFAGIFLRAGTVGIPIGDPNGQALGLTFFVQALAAAVIGRMERFVVIATAAIGLGVLDKAMTFQPGNRPAFNDVVLFLVVLGALLWVRRPGRGRVDAEQTSTWQAVREIRPIPRELARLPEVKLLRWLPPLLLVGVLVTLPLWLSQSRMNLATVTVIFGIIGVSLVVLSGWAGQVSLGHMAFVGVGAAVGGGLTDHLGWDLSLAVIVGGITGAVAATVIGIPSLRRRGYTLAVSTLAFSLFVSAYVLNREFFDDRLPAFRIDRPDLFGVIDITTETRFYYLSVVALAIAVFIVYGLRRSRTGRVLIAIRENDRAVRAYGVDAARTTLAGFAISGFLAAFAGALFVHQQTGLGVEPYLPQSSLKVFTMVVIGGLGSVPGALLGSTYVQSVDFFLPGDWQFFATGVGLLLVLMILPGGLGSVIYECRDWILRRIADRRGIVVPSLVADRRVEEAAPEPVLEEAKEAVERAPAEVSP
jgi:branched-chain amino acid transport system permease protein